MTSRRRLLFPGAEPREELSVLTPEQACELFKKVAGRDTYGKRRVSEENRRALRILTARRAHCWRHPRHGSNLDRRRTRRSSSNEKERLDLLEWGDEEIRAALLSVTPHWTLKISWHFDSSAS